MLTHLLLIGSGGFIGSVCRYLLSLTIQKASNGFLFPLGTLSVNLIGCLLIGLLAGLAEFRGLLSPEIRMFLLIGILGGFTTFSTFGYETYQLFRDGQAHFAVMNALLSVGLGILGVWAGFVLARSI